MISILSVFRLFRVLSRMESKIKKNKMYSVKHRKDNFKVSKHKPKSVGLRTNFYSTKKYIEFDCIFLIIDFLKAGKIVMVEVCLFGPRTR